MGKINEQFDGFLVRLSVLCIIFILMSHHTWQLVINVYLIECLILIISLHFEQYVNGGCVF